MQKSSIELDGLPRWIELLHHPGPNYICEPDHRTVMLIEKMIERDKLLEAYGWILTNIFDPSLHPKLQNAPWDFQPVSFDIKYTKKVWVKQWVSLDVDEMVIVKSPQAEIQNTITSFYRNKKERLIYRIAEDHEVYYGDGGEDPLVYPIWKCDKLDISEHTRQNFVECLHNLSAARKDYQKNSPVEDIIDPDLSPCMLPKPDWFTWRVTHLKNLEKNAAGWTSSRISRERRDLQANKQRGWLEDDKLSENIKLRSSYQWIPSEFKIDPQGKVTICSRIHNLAPHAENKPLYIAIKKVFEAMVPMFAKLNLIKTNQDTNLQVIVKAQSYNMQPGMSYAGRWHMEGQTENIVAAGVYYPHVGSELQGGNLKFRPNVAPQPCYGIRTDHETTIEEGNAVVFSNTLPHRFRKITNKSACPQRRTFINFFIVDPSRPIPSTKTLLHPEYLHKALRYYVSAHLNQSLPSEIASYIISWVPGVWSTTSAAKAFRQKARQAMVEEKSGWGWINWGNCGDTKFIASASTWSDRTEELHHTDSDSTTDIGLYLGGTDNSPFGGSEESANSLFTRFKFNPERLRNFIYMLYFRMQTKSLKKK